MATYYKRLLNSFVDKSDCGMDIISLLPFINIDSLQQFLKNEIKQFNDDTARKAYYESVSIMDILPDDIMQHIISFNLDSKSRFVNKQCNKQVNQENKKFVTEQHNAFNPIIPFKKNINNTWIINKDRKILNETEIENGYKGPIESIDEAIEKCQSGDKLLISDGKYECDLAVSNDVHLIGVGDNVSISSKCSVYVDDMSTDKKCNVYFENISIEAPPDESVINVSNSNLWMKNCEIRSTGRSGDIGVMVRDDSNFMAKDCIFWNGILMSPTLCNVLVIGCIFKRSMDICNTLSGAIEIFDNYSDILDPQEEFEFCNLKCIDNVFEEIVKYPITMRDFDYDQDDIYPEFMYDMLNHIVLKRNLWKEKKAIKLFNELVPSVFHVESADR
eukprot:107962_1